MGICVACATGLGLYKRALAVTHAEERVKLIEFDFDMNYRFVIM